MGEFVRESMEWREAIEDRKIYFGLWRNLQYFMAVHRISKCTVVCFTSLCCLLVLIRNKSKKKDCMSKMDGEYCYRYTYNFGNRIILRKILTSISRNTPVFIQNFPCV